MNFIEAISTCMRKYIDFDGRDSRSQFWYFFLFLAIIQCLFINLPVWASGMPSFRFGVHLGLGPHFPVWQNVFTVLFTLPLLSVIARRCHDIGQSASKIVLIGFVILVAAVFGKMLVSSPLSLRIYSFALLTPILCSFTYLTLAGSRRGTNKFGPNPNEVPS